MEVTVQVVYIDVLLMYTDPKSNSTPTLTLTLILIFQFVYGIKNTDNVLRNSIAFQLDIKNIYPSQRVNLVL